MKRTVTDTFGREAADALAAWAIDVLVWPPADIRTFATTLPADEIRRGRELLTDAGIDWRKLKSDGRSAGRALRETKRARLWHPEITALEPGDECEFRYPARTEFMPAVVVKNGGAFTWEVRLEDGSIEKCFAEQVKAKGGSYYTDPEG